MRLLIIAGIVFISIDNFACSCDHVGITKNKRQADFVFEGRVIDIQETTTQEFESRTNNKIEYRLTRYTFDILKNNKGLEEKKTIELLSGMTDCELSFVKDKTYIVYAYTDNKKLHYRLTDQEVKPYITTHLCTRTRKKTMFTFWESFILWLT